jgi:hypothetical protein
MTDSTTARTYTVWDAGTVTSAVNQRLGRRPYFVHAVARLQVLIEEITHGCISGPAHSSLPVLANAKRAEHSS